MNSWLWFILGFGVGIGTMLLLMTVGFLYVKSRTAKQVKAIQGAMDEMFKTLQPQIDKKDGRISSPSR